MISIRKAVASDRSELQDCFAELQAFERLLEPNRAAPETIADAYIDGLLADCADTGGAIFVAETDEGIVGFVCVLSRKISKDIIYQEREHAYVTDLVVSKDYRNRGVGKQLMHAAEAHASASGATRIRVGVLNANVVAHGLYRQLGYIDNEIVLEKRLGATVEAT
jgi:ribosomal protein S18 acetylase RimI-like enzyme